MTTDSRAQTIQHLLSIVHRLSSPLVRPTILLGALFTVDKLIGLFRQAIVADTFDIGASLDAYNAANNLPDTVVTLLAGGALAVAFIPVLTESLDRDGRDAMWSLFSRLLNLASGLAAVCALGLALFAEPFVQLVVVPDFPPEQQALTASLMRINLIAMLLFVISGLVTGGLQAHQHFLLPGLAPILYDLGQIVGIFFLAPHLGIYGLACGVVLGAALHLAIQLPGLLRFGFRWTPTLDWRHPGVSRIARVIGPRVINIAAFQLIIIFTDRFASGLNEGSVAALAYGWQIMQMPQTVIGTAAATVLLPTLADLVARGDADGLRRTLRRALGVLMALLLPITVISMIALGPALQLAARLKLLSANGAALVLAAALAFLPGMLGHTVVDLGVRAFYAHQRPLWPVLAAALTAAAFYLLCAGLVPRLGHAGIALANTLAFSLEALAYLWMMRRGGML